MIRIFSFLLLIMLLFTFFGYFVAGLIGMLVSLIFSIFFNFIVYFYSHTIIVKSYRAKPLANEHIYSILKRLCNEAKMKTIPKLYVIPSMVPNAFATGRSEKNSSIVITEGLLELNEEEIEGVLAHEIAHIKGRDMLITTIAVSVAGAISYIAQIVYWNFLFSERREANPLSLLLVIVLAPLAATLLRLALSRNMEYRADYKAALITKKPRALASALRKIDEISRNAPITFGSVATSSLWIVNPFKRDWFTNLFSTHPPVDKRVKKLEKM